MSRIAQVAFLRKMRPQAMALDASVALGWQARMFGRKRSSMSKGDCLELGIMAVSLIVSAAVISHVVFAVWFALLSCG